MKLTQKDKEFLERLRTLMDEKALWIELAEDGIKHLVLRQNYGDRIESAFRLSRQGVRWRFQRIFSQIYVESYLAILWIESNFGTELRSKALAIARQRYELSQKVENLVKTEFPRRQLGHEPAKSEPNTLTRDLPSAKDL